MCVCVRANPSSFAVAPATMTTTTTIGQECHLRTEREPAAAKFMGFHCELKGSLTEIEKKRAKDLYRMAIECAEIEMGGGSRRRRAKKKENGYIK